MVHEVPRKRALHQMIRRLAVNCVREMLENQDEVKK